MQKLRADGARACDKLALETLILLGREVGREPSITVQSVRRARSGFGTALRVLLRVDEALHAGRCHDLILECFARRGIHPSDAQEARPMPAVSEPARNNKVATRSRRGARVIRRRDDESSAVADLAAVRSRMARHVESEDVPDTEDLFGRGELGARLRALDEPPLSVVATGDTMLGSRTKRVIAQQGAEYVFKFVRPLLRRASIVIGN